MATRTVKDLVGPTDGETTGRWDIQHIHMLDISRSGWDQHSNTYEKARWPFKLISSFLFTLTSSVTSSNGKIKMQWLSSQHSNPRVWSLVPFKQYSMLLSYLKNLESGWFSKYRTAYPKKWYCGGSGLPHRFRESLQALCCMSCIVEYNSSYSLPYRLLRPSQLLADLQLS